MADEIDDVLKSFEFESQVEDTGETLRLLSAHDIAAGPAEFEIDGIRQVGLAISSTEFEKLNVLLRKALEYHLEEE
jgi:hypothetical protein